MYTQTVAHYQQLCVTVIKIRTHLGETG